MIDECITVAKMFGGDMVIGKNRDRNYKPKLKIVRDRTSYGVEVCYVIDADTDWTEGMNEYGIGVVNTALFVKRDEKDYNKKNLCKFVFMKQLSKPSYRENLKQNLGKYLCVNDSSGENGNLNDKYNMVNDITINFYEKIFPEKTYFEK